jgi:hypothetical protein
MSVRPSLPYHGIARRALSAEAVISFDHDVIIIDTDDNICRDDTWYKGWYKGSLKGLAAAFAAPLRRRLDYSDIARKAFIIDQLPQGALPTYDRDIDVSAIVKGDDE